MFDISKILIYKAVIHTLNKSKEYPVYSSFEVDHEEELTHEILKGYIEKLHSSQEMKWAAFGENSEYIPMIESLDEDLSLFMNVTKDLTYIMHKIIFDNCDALPSCDMAFILFEMEGVMYLSIIKLNYKNLFIRKLEATSDGAIAALRNSNDLYLSKNSKVEEGVIIHLKHLDIALLEKVYNVKGEKVGYFKDLVFKLESGMSEKEKLKAFNQINKRIQEKFIGEDLEQKAYIKKVISDTIVEEGTLDVEKVIDNAFEDGKEVKTLFKEALKKANLDKEHIKVGERNIKKFDMQKIITDTGIEINIPVELYNNIEKLEIVPNKDGTMTMIIKNIDEFKSV